MNHAILIGIAGGTGSGKTLVVKTLMERLGSDRVLMIQQDAYYKDLSHLKLEDRTAQNFDHPDAFDEELLIGHVEELLAGNPIERPIYDYSHHLRTDKTQRQGGQEILIVEGLLVLHSRRLRELMDIKVYVDADADIRLIRRLRRDLQERGRSTESILNQYEKSVRPMHLQFVEPTKRYADIIIPEGGKNYVAIDLLQTKIESILSQGVPKSFGPP